MQFISYRSARCPGVRNSAASTNRSCLSSSQCWSLTFNSILTSWRLVHQKNCQPLCDCWRGCGKKRFDVNLRHFYRLCSDRDARCPGWPESQHKHSIRRWPSISWFAASPTPLRSPRLFERWCKAAGIRVVLSPSITYGRRTITLALTCYQRLATTGPRKT